MNHFQAYTCLMIAIALTFPVAMKRDTPNELRLVAWITLCAAELLLVILAVMMIMQ